MSVSKDVWPENHEYLASIDEVSSLTHELMKPYPRGAWNSHCDDGDGRSFCDCQIYFESINHCMHYTKQVEPLAFSLINTNSINQQHMSPLFGIIPAEVREEIWKAALTDCTSRPYGADFEPRGIYASTYESSLPASDIAVSLLQTCKRAYMEAYKLPFLLNPFIVYQLNVGMKQTVARPCMSKLLPWQFALISRLDITGGILQSHHLGDKLTDHLSAWRAQDRHQGAVVAPRFYAERFWYEMDQSPVDPSVNTSFVFGLVHVGKEREDGMHISLKTKGDTFYDRRLWKTGLEKRDWTGVATRRTMIARPLTHLTLRLSRTEWYWWEVDPTGEVPPENRLALEPTCRDIQSGTDRLTRTLYSWMLQRTAERRAGLNPPLIKRNPLSWGAEISSMPDLKCFELVMETFSTKKAQLEDVVECAKWWRFPLDGTSNELVWDGKVEELRYQNRLIEKGHGEDKPRWWLDDIDVEVRIMRFKRT